MGWFRIFLAVTWSPLALLFPGNGKASMTNILMDISDIVDGAKAPSRLERIVTSQVLPTMIRHKERAFAGNSKR